MYLLDTCTCIYLINERPPAARAHFDRHEPGEVGVSSVTVSELWYGVAKSQRPQKNGRALEKFLVALLQLDYGPEAAAAYGQLRATLERRGELIGAMDLMIAAHALSLDATLVTNNLREFRRVDGLHLEDWSVPSR
ncbi:MAG: type II toxin-antitoxin system VapC family toxin [Myxococcales bacterium]|nr:type II toxin-antitoxin system VapC family toxin [Myxococcales bacterium]MCB9535444.1 type II toxin-antitoxin system VapC family toxin [Myxococcales bacterium]